MIADFLQRIILINIGFSIFLQPMPYLLVSCISIKIIHSEMTMKLVSKSIRSLITVSAIGLSLLSNPVSAADDNKSVKVGFVMFLSGAASGPFGIPAKQAAELLVDSINAGSLPAPYNSVGLAGAKISPIYTDEASKQKVADYKKLVQKDEVDIVIGYISSGSCKAIAPVAEQEKTLTVFFDCGTPQIFEEIITNPSYVYRTAASSTMDSVAAAKYLLSEKGSVKSIAGINQNYAWGQDSWRDFSESIKALGGKVDIATEQFPKIYAGQYGSEISVILTKKPDVVHSSFWGGDMEALVLQAGARGVFSRSQVVLTTGESAMHRLGKQIPDGTIIGARGPNGDLAPASELNTWFREAYLKRFGSLPTYPSYHMAQALLGVKAAADKAGKSDITSINTALKGSEFATPSGPVYMSLANGHQATQETAYGTFKFDKKTKAATVTNVKRYPAECVNPPEGVNSIDWIKSGFKGAKC
ncbi:MAG: branched-chain amino acid transport system substrate-binding protein [Cellvibrionaceae bacterium]|jgi:branched-chain amino acid transport system substrate-binding protein